MSQRSRRSFPNSVRFQRQPGAAHRNRQRMRQHGTRERRRILPVHHAYRTGLRRIGVEHFAVDYPLGAPGLFWWRRM